MPNIHKPRKKDAFLQVFSKIEPLHMKKPALSHLLATK
jgi:hypothetical protein